MKMFMGKNWGVAVGPNGYYVGPVESTGRIEFMPSNGGFGRTYRDLSDCNREAELLEFGATNGAREIAGLVAQSDEVNWTEGDAHWAHI